MTIDKGIENGVGAADVAVGARADRAAAAGMAEMGAVRRDPRHGPASRSTLPEAERLRGAVRRQERAPPIPRSTPDLARDAARSTPIRLYDGADRRRAAAGRDQRRGCATCPTKGIYNWDPGRAFRHLPPGRFWFDARGPRGLGGA